MNLLASTGVALRCAYCHGPIGRITPCAGCGTLVHPECLAETGRCPSLGCAERPSPCATPFLEIVNHVVQLGLLHFAYVVVIHLIASGPFPIHP